MVLLKEEAWIMLLFLLIEKYNQNKDENEGAGMLTNKQKLWLETIKLALTSRAQVVMLPPKEKWRLPFFRFVTRPGFDIFIMVAIVANTLLMALRHPLMLSQTLGTADLSSQGRLLIAAGTGGAFNNKQEQEWQSVGGKATQRARRLEEMLQIIKGLNRGEQVSFQG